MPLWAAAAFVLSASALAYSGPRAHDRERRAADEARQVLANIRSGPPFPFERDGITFGNRERLLPQKPRGYYHEYTVRTPGVKSRGARRIVCGGAPRTPDACWYSSDHYQSFARIVE
jgi:ribonuclease T1